jgi:hypothetical protein
MVRYEAEKRLTAFGLKEPDASFCLSYEGEVASCVSRPGAALALLLSPFSF